MSFDAETLERMGVVSVAPLAIEDFVWSLDLAAALGATATRMTARTARCEECDQLVYVVQDLTPRLTSSGTRWSWVDRRPLTHARACWDAAEAKRAAARKLTPDDVWPSRPNF